MPLQAGQYDERRGVLKVLLDEHGELERLGWSEGYWRNPLVLCVTGVRGARFRGEDALAYLPWFFVTVLEIAAIHAAIHSFVPPGVMVWLGLPLMVAVMLLGGFCGAVCQTLHARQVMRRWNLSELLLTNLTAPEIAYGFSARPLAIQKRAIWVNSAVALVLWTVFLAAALSTVLGVGEAVMLLIVYTVWQFLIRVIVAYGAVGAGSALALREILLRGGEGAGWRAAGTWTLMAFLILFAFELLVFVYPMTVGQASASNGFAILSAIASVVVGGPILMISVGVGFYHWEEAIQKEILARRGEWRHTADRRAPASSREAALTMARDVLEGLRLSLCKRVVRG
ncbi:MAG: hypothetical protein RLY93_13025 [Sumerlaeia bacterium]